MPNVAVKSVVRDRPRVMFSFGPSTEDANPYVDLLASSVATHVSVSYFSWARALMGGYDIFHLHWPEALTRRPGRLRSLVAQLLLITLLLKLTVFRIPLVRTEHNLRPHERGGWLESLVLDLLDRRTSAWIAMNRASPRWLEGTATLILHGHYRDRYSAPIGCMKEAGSILNFGLIRPYKGVEDLVAAFKKISLKNGLTLRIMGKPLSAEIEGALVSLIGDEKNIIADLRHIPEAELAESVTQSELVILPYQSMHNSGVLLLALSLGTPVLVPKNPITDDLADEVGEGWVQRFEGPISPDAIDTAYMAVRGLSGAPNLEAREWTAIATQHLAVYRKVLQARLKY